MSPWCHWHCYFTAWNLFHFLSLVILKFCFLSGWVFDHVWTFDDSDDDGWWSVMSKAQSQSSLCMYCLLAFCLWRFVYSFYFASSDHVFCLRYPKVSIWLHCQMLDCEWISVQFLVWCQRIKNNVMSPVKIWLMNVVYLKILSVSLKIVYLLVVSQVFFHLPV